MKKIRIGHIGTLHDHGAPTITALRKMSDVFDVVGYVPESEERYREVKGWVAYKDVQAMTLEELFSAGIDAAVIEGFEKDLIPTAQICIDYGIHVHIDKPAGEDIDAFERLLNSAKEKGLVVQMGYMYRYNPAVRKALEIAKNGKLGKIYSVEAQMNCLHPIEKQNWLGNFKGGMMFFLGCHLIDLIAQFQGIPEEIIPMNMSIGENGVTAENFGMAVLKYKNGVSFAKSTAVEANGFYRRQLVVCGSEGTIEIKPLEMFDVDPKNTYLSTNMNICYNNDASDWGDHNTKMDTPEYDRYDVMLGEFAKCISGEIENPYSYDYELKLHKMVLKACGYDIDWKK